jgi:hypothetical protein
MEDAEARLNGFIAKFTPEIAQQTHAIVARMRMRLPTANILVYDNYNALAIGFGPGERSSEAIFSIAVFPRWVSLFFLQGAGLPDPDEMLEGEGTKARHIKLKTPELLDDARVVRLMDVARERAIRPLDEAGRGRVIIKSVSARQRPRRPGEA